MPERPDGRSPEQLRPITFTPDFLKFAAGSVLVSYGDTKVICAASVEDQVPPFLSGTGKGWVTGEYSMMPASSPVRVSREVNRGRPGGRTQEIQRLIGRAVRAVTDLRLVGDRTFTLDCDVIQADGGTRTASVSGACVALALAMHRLQKQGKMATIALSDLVAGVSVGLVEGKVWADLCYAEDVRADVDMNVIMTGSGEVVEVQGTAEGRPFSRTQLAMMTDAAARASEEIIAKQREVLERFGIQLRAI